MRAPRWITAAAVAAVAACTAYDESLLLPLPTGGSGGDVTGGTGGVPSGGVSTGGVLTGGSGGMPSGGVPTGGVPTGGSGGMPSGGVPTGGVPTGGSGGMPSGGVPTGGVPTGGSGGGLVPCTVGSPPADGTYTLDMIDDMEDGNTRIIQVTSPQRTGGWTVFHDTTADGVMSPQVGGLFQPQLLDGVRDTSHGLHVTATGYLQYAGLNVDLNNVSMKLTYDASAYAGITFWAKGSASAVGSFMFLANTSATVPPAQGGTCTSNCNDVHGSAVALTSAWQQFFFPMCSLRQAGWGTQVAFDPSRIISLQFQGKGGCDFELWLDDIAFYTTS